MQRPSDTYALLAGIVGAGSLAADAGFQKAIDSAFPTWGPVILGGLGFAGLVAAKIISNQSNPSPPPGFSSVVVAIANKPPTVSAALTPDGTVIVPSANAAQPQGAPK